MLARLLLFLLQLLVLASIKSNAAFWNVYDQENDNLSKDIKTEPFFQNLTVQYGVDIVRITIDCIDDSKLLFQIYQSIDANILMTSSYFI
jgi:hypothetical protein